LKEVNSKENCQNLYEIIFIARPELAQKQVEAIRETISKKVPDNSIKKTEFCGKRTLAYPINKCKEGNYVLLNIESDSSQSIIEIENELRHNTDVLRFLTINLGKLNDEEYNRHLDHSPLSKSSSVRKEVRATEEFA